MARVERAPDAERDLIEIGLYIAQKSRSRKTAYRLLDRIHHTCNLLATQPEMGQLRRSSPPDNTVAFRWETTSFITAPPPPAFELPESSTVPVTTMLSFEHC